MKHTKSKHFFIVKKLKKQKFNRMNLKSNLIVGCTSRLFLKKKIAINVNHPFGGLKNDLFFNLQKNFKNLPNFNNQIKIKEDAFLKIEKMDGYKSTRLQRKLPLRGQRTHTNAKTRKKRNVI